MKISTLACLALLFQGGLGGPTIEPPLMKALQQGGTANVSVTMRNSTSSILEGFKERIFATRGDRITAMATELQEFAEASQANVIIFLEEEHSRADGGWSFRSFWISNQIFIRGASKELVEKLGAFNEIESIAVEKTLEVGKLTVRTSAVIPALRDAKQSARTTWNIQQIRAPEVWETEGNNGAGIVVATIGTGVEATHEALTNTYRRHYGWFDSDCLSDEPFDGDGHGTETIGPILGAYGIGVAPGSQWIACKACGTRGCFEEYFIGCGQWVFCPTDAYGQNPNCSMAPHVVSNSWGVGRSNRWYKPVTDAWYSAGIIPIFEAGDYGRDGCSSLTSPADYDNVLAVGATQPDVILSNFSSLGPSQLTSEFKPDVVAPGEYIWTTSWQSDTDYSEVFGTGMATPQVAGTVALMLASRPEDSPCFEKIQKALRESSEKARSQDGRCGDVRDDQRPNYHHGYGFINALKAVQIYKNMSAACP